MFQYDPFNFTKNIEYNGNIFAFDPTITVPVPEDDENFGRTLQQIYSMSDEEANTIVNEEKWAQIRKYRDTLLKETDWVSGEDVPQAIKNLYFPYRQALRDITDTDNPDNVVWPTAPGE